MQKGILSIDDIKSKFQSILKNREDAVHPAASIFSQELGSNVKISRASAVLVGKFALIFYKWYNYMYSKNILKYFPMIYCQKMLDLCIYSKDPYT